MKYLKNILNNIKWFVCNDIYSYCTTSTYNSHAYSQIIRNIEKDLQVSNGVINENYQTLLNKSIDNRNMIREHEVLIDNLFNKSKDNKNKLDIVETLELIQSLSKKWANYRKKANDKLNNV